MMLELLDITSWPVWIQVPAILSGLWMLFKMATVPYWGPSV